MFLECQVFNLPLPATNASQATYKNANVANLKIKGYEEIKPIQKIPQ